MKQLNSQVEKFLKCFFDGTQFSFGFVQKDEISFYGFHKEKGKIKSVENSEVVFEVGSITKVFTADILAQLLLENKINLQDKISQYLPYPRVKNSNITFEQLANHSSGVPRLPEIFYTVPNYNEANPYKSYDEAALIDYFENHLKLEFEPGSKVVYSNLGTGILSYLISKIEEKNFEQVVQERIFKPLQMNSSSFDIQQVTNLIRGINQTGKVANHWEGGILNGCIGALSSAYDMCKFIQHIISKNPISNLQTNPTIEIEANYQIGLSWGLRTQKDGSMLVSHGGGSDGYTSFMKINRTHQKGFI